MNSAGTNSGNPNPATKRKLLRLLEWRLALLALLIGAFTTTAAWWVAREDAVDELKMEFDFRVTGIENHLKGRVINYSQILHGVRGFYTASEKVTRNELSKFITSLNTKQHFPEVHDVGVTMLIPSGRLQQHVADMRRQGVQDYAVWPTGKRQNYAPIILHEMVKESGVHTVGYDQLSDLDRRNAMESSRDTGNLAITSKVTLQGTWEQADAAHLLMFLPIYKNGTPAETIENRRENIVGWVFAPLFVDELMTGMAENASSNIAVAIHDGEEVSEKNRLFDSSKLPFGVHLGKLNFSAVRKIELGTRTWTLSFYSTPAFEARLNSGKSQMIAWLGCLTSILLAALVWLLASGRSRALAMADQLTADLQESESRFRLMADAAPAQIWISDASQKRLWVNRGWLDFIGAADIDEFNIKWKKCVHPDDCEQYEAIRNTAHDQQKPFSSEYRALRHDGQYRWLMSKAVPRFNEKGDFVGLIGSAIDISERKLAEEKLTQTSLVYQNSSEAMLVANVDSASRKSTIIDANPAFASLTGYASSEIIGKAIDILYEDEREQPIDELIRQTLISSGSWQGEYRIRCKNAETRLGWLNISAIFDASGNICRYVSLLRDITQQKEDEERLQLAALVYQNSNDSMMVMDVDPIKHTATIVNVNPAFTRTTGYLAEEIIGQSAESLKSPYHSAEYYESMHKELVERGYWHGEFKRMRKNGDSVVSWLSLHAVYDSHGVMTRYVSLARDITRQKEAEETIRALTANLITAKEEEARRIAREIHDDLGQRLSWLRMNLLLLPKLFQSKPEQVNDLIERMKESVEHVLAVVRNISSNLRPATLDMGFMMAVKWQIENFRENTGIACELKNSLDDNFHLPDEPATCVFRILQEALTNVARHASASNVTVTLKLHDDNLMLQISDNGVGFDSGAQRKPRSSGFAGMRERATMLGGIIEFLSGPGKGSTVTVAVPLATVLH